MNREYRNLGESQKRQVIIGTPPGLRNKYMCVPGEKLETSTYSNGSEEDVLTYHGKASFRGVLNRASLLKVRESRSDAGTREEEIADMLL